MNLVPGDQQLSVLLAELEQNRGEMGFQGAESHTLRRNSFFPYQDMQPQHSAPTSC